jgi:hypothetical protein
MLISQKLESEASTLSDARHSQIKWHPTRDILGVSSYTGSLGGYVSFVSKTVSRAQLKMVIII